VLGGERGRLTAVHYGLDDRGRQPGELDQPGKAMAALPRGGRYVLDAHVRSFQHGRPCHLGLSDEGDQRRVTIVRPIDQDKLDLLADAGAVEAGNGLANTVAERTAQRSRGRQQASCPMPPNDPDSSMKMCMGLKVSV
jgi:hypothetical protein